MVKELKEMGMELMVSVWPQIDTLSENFAEMKQKGLLVKTEYADTIRHLFFPKKTHVFRQIKSVAYPRGYP